MCPREGNKVEVRKVEKSVIWMEPQEGTVESLKVRRVLVPQTLQTPL